MLAIVTEIAEKAHGFSRGTRVLREAELHRKPAHESADPLGSVTLSLRLSPLISSRKTSV